MERTIISDRVRSVLLRVSDYDQELGELLMLGQALVAHPHLDLRIVRDQIAVECNVSPDALRLQRQTTIRELIDQIVSLAAKND